MLYLSRVKLKNVRCFDKLDIKLSSHCLPGSWTLFVGDNATGKSTLLRSIAMGLCDEASAAGLLKESDEGYIRRGHDEARITIWLDDPSHPEDSFRILTRVIRKKGKRGIFSDIVRQTTLPRRDEFPWDEIFVSAYGAGRGVAGTGDISAYSAIDAVYNLFNYAEGLQNPELTIRRIGRGNPMDGREILGVLQAFTRTEGIRLTSGGIRVDGPWGEGMPLRDLADGYRSAFIWLTDLIGWALAYKPTLKSCRGMRGIVLIDELEQHLHAVWQRSVVDDLRRLFPNIQFLATTHSPLIASRVGEDTPRDKGDRLFVLEVQDDKQVKAYSHDFMRGWRMDQVLASRAFKYLIDDDPAIERMLRDASILAGKKRRTPDEEARYKRLNAALRPILLSDGHTLYERTLELGCIEEIRRRIKSIEQETRIR